MKTNEKYQDNPITRREGEPMIEFLRRKFPERNIKHGVPETYINDEETIRVEKFIDDFF